MMKDFLIIIKIAFVGLFVVAFVHPIIHESGHILATLLTGGKIVEFTVWPIPSIGCIADSTNTLGLIMTSLSGIVLPIILSGLLWWSNRTLRLGVLIFQFVTILSVVIGIIVSILYKFGNVIPNDDVSTLINLTNSPEAVMIIMVVLLIISLHQFIKTNPRKTIMKVLGIP